MGGLYFECDVQGCSARVFVPYQFLDMGDHGGDFEHGLMEESKDSLQSVGWFVIGINTFVCPAHGTREQVERMLDWRQLR